MAAQNVITTMLVAAARKKAEDAGVPGVLFDMVVSKLDGGGEAIATYVHTAIDANRAAAIASLASAAKDLTAVASAVAGPEVDAVLDLRTSVLADLAALYDTDDDGDDDDEPEVPPAS